MNLDNTLAELENDLNWRFQEMRFLGNIMRNLASEREKEIFRKSMVMMLYAHYEGFSKVAFGTYAAEINKLKLSCGEVNDFITAASLSDLFAALFDTNQKCDLFRNSLPDDPVVHRLSRQVELVSSINELWKRTATIPVDAVVDTDSNLKPKILRKILYRLGFPHDSFKEHEGKIHYLLEIRNNVAHGNKVSGIKEKDYSELEAVTLEILNQIKLLIWKALKDSTFKRSTNTLLDSKAIA